MCLQIGGVASRRAARCRWLAKESILVCVKDIPEPIREVTNVPAIKRIHASTVEHPAIGAAAILLAGGALAAIALTSAISESTASERSAKADDAVTKRLAKAASPNVRIRLVATKSGNRATVRAIAKYRDGRGDWVSAGRAQLGGRGAWRWRAVTAESGGVYKFATFFPRDETPLYLTVKLYKHATDLRKVTAPFRFTIVDGKLQPIDV